MKIIPILTLCLLFHLSSFGQFSMPSFKEVITTFFQQYKFENDLRLIKFQRKKDGWHVAEANYEKPDQTIYQQLFWDNDNKIYKSLRYNTWGPDSTKLKQLVDEYCEQIDFDFENYQFLRHRFYGYTGWDWDVINDSSIKTSLTDTMLESKARAYFNYASGFIAEQYGDVFLNDDADRIPLKANEPIPPSRINKFLSYQNKTLDAYTQLMKMNPSYETKVGNISLKLANEYMFTYLELMMAGDSIRAMEYAQKAEYSDSILALSLSYLKDLPSNSILITGGDNDTYPLWYLQQIEKFRPDIDVLNYNLIGFERYISLIGKNTQQKLFSLKEHSYVNEYFKYFLYGNNGKDTALDVTTFLYDIERNENPYDTTTVYFNDGIVRKYYSRKLYFNMEGKQKSTIFTVGSYIFLNDYVLLDIINTSRKRTIYFTFYNTLLQDFLELEGNMFKLALKMDE